MRLAERVGYRPRERRFAGRGGLLSLGVCVREMADDERGEQVADPGEVAWEAREALGMYEVPFSRGCDTGEVVGVGAVGWWAKVRRKELLQPFLERNRADDDVRHLVRLVECPNRFTEGLRISDGGAGEDPVPE